ncbi:MAG: phosphatidate cytidylyltransferase [Ruminococcus sp.]|nr:phosphatidate cytidylyltransferase [Ruminococcus sp.]MDE7098938.1 phosphatidate cytidylyltransferase [Ruminococcus sp.]
MLTRIISAVVGIAVAVTVLCLHETIVLPIAVAVVIAIMLFELIRAVKLERCYPILITAEFFAIGEPIRNILNSLISLHYDAFSHYVIVSTILYSLQFLCVFVIFAVWLKKHKEIQYTQIFFVLACMFMIPRSMMCIIGLNDLPHSVFLILMGLCGAWIADSGAYFTGVALGKHKLCPEISPKKTVEGFIGGIVSTAVFFVIALFVYKEIIADTPCKINYILFGIAGAVCAVVGTLGDLSASMVKRQIGFKDYGKIMPGHGGFMDRFDSVLFVLPAFSVFLNLLIK